MVRDMLHTVNELKDSILMYPEASYTFDGTATPLPESVGKLLKMLKVPVVMICIGDHKTLYYCFPLEEGDVVAKTRLAAEELYKIYKENKKSRRG